MSNYNRVYCQKCGTEITGFSEHETIAAWNHPAEARKIMNETEGIKK